MTTEDLCQSRAGKGEHVEKRMAAAYIEHTLEQLVEADRDRNEAARAISDYQAKVTEPAPPPPPPVFEDLDALLSLYLRPQEYY